MDNFYVVTSGSYSDYGISFICKSPKEITEEQLRKYHLEAIKRSSEFDDAQLTKLGKHLGDDSIKSTNPYSIFPGFGHKDARISWEDWERLSNEAGIEENPHDWFERLLTENGCEIISYEEFNTDDWD